MTERKSNTRLSRSKGSADTEERALQATIWSEFDLFGTLGQHQKSGVLWINEVVRFSGRDHTRNRQN